MPKGIIELCAKDAAHSHLCGFIQNIFAKGNSTRMPNQAEI